MAGATTPRRGRAAFTPDLVVPAGCAIYKVAYDTCAGKMTLRMAAPHRTASPRCDDGCVRDACWSLGDGARAQRYVRLLDGRKSLWQLFSQYAMRDGSDCLNAASGRAHWAPLADVLAACRATAARVPRALRAGTVTGVPQRLPNSGICWYAAVCFALFYNRAFRAYWLGRLKEPLRTHARRALRCPKAAEALREALWHRHAVGDPIGQSPHLDGQNGMSQLFVLAACYDVPIKRFFVDDDSVAYQILGPVRNKADVAMELRAAPRSASEPHTIVFRFNRGAHGAGQMPQRRIRHEGRRYKLVAILMGSTSCGHQIATACADGSWRRWAVACADMRRKGIGPICWTAPRMADKRAEEREWWRLFKQNVPTVHRGASNVCQLTPWNLSDERPCVDGACALPKCQRGLVNCDFVYFSDGAPA